MAHNRDSLPGDDLYEQSLLAELEAVEPSTLAGASAVPSPVAGEGVAEVLAQMDLGQNPLRDIRSETPSNIFKGLIHKATRKRSKSLDSNAVRSTEPIVESRRDHPMQLGARPKIRQSRQVATAAQVLRKDSDGGKKSLARIDPLALDNSERERLILAISKMPNGSPVSYTHLTLPTTPYV